MHRLTLNDTQDAALNAATDALSQGRTHDAYELALSLLTEVQDGNAHLQARALAFMAHCDRINSRLRRASETSRKAAQLFEQLGDVHGEINALTTLAHVCMLLGRNDEAVEAALLSVRLCETQDPQPPTVLALNCLGLAYSWSGDHQRGNAALEKAVAVALTCSPPVSTYQPLVNHVWVEASRLVDERFRTGSMTSLTRLQSMVAECRALELAGHGSALLPGLHLMRKVIAPASWSLLAAWQGDLPEAQTQLAIAERALSENITWLNAFVRWCAAEIAWATQDWATTQAELEAMRSLALDVEHEQLACRAHLLLIQIFEIQGRLKDALRENHALRQREQRAVDDGLRSREALVSWRLDARQSDRHLQQALVASKQFERWSLEDALTGIANRRHFEQSLAERLQTMAGNRGSLVVALADIDEFKAINDRFTHQVGDRVLKTVAAIICSQLDKGDLPARWAGDEFVILFGGRSLEMALSACERVRSSIALFDWQSIHVGLQVTISVGWSDSLPGDSVESLLHRSDKAMYLVKGMATG